MNDERSQILERLQAQADELLGQTPTLFAYGIADPGEFPALRDVHLAAYMEPGLPPESYFHVEIRLETLLEEALAVPAAGARILNGAPLTFQGAVLTAGRAIYSRDEGSRIAFEERVRALGDLSSPDPIKEVAGRYALQSAITSCLAVCLHLASALKLRPPRDLTDIPEVLAEVGLLERELARELVQLIEIRAQLVYDPGGEERPLGQELLPRLARLQEFADGVRTRFQL